MVTLACHNRSGQGPPVTQPMTLRVQSCRPVLAGGISSSPLVLKFHSIKNALCKHSDTGKENTKVHLFMSMPSKPTDYRNQDQLEPKQQQKHGDTRPPEPRVSVQKNPQAGKPVSSLRSMLHASFSPSSTFCLSQLRPGQCQGGVARCPVAAPCGGAVSHPWAWAACGRAVDRSAPQSASGAPAPSAAALTSPAPRQARPASACSRWSGASPRWLRGSGSCHLPPGE